MAGHTVSFCQTTHKLFVAVAFFSTQVEVAMRYLETVAAPMQQLSQHDRIPPAADGCEDRLSYVKSWGHFFGGGRRALRILRILIILRVQRILIILRI